jgi:hypothetical protein
VQTNGENVVVHGASRKVVKMIKLLPEGMEDQPEFPADTARMNRRLVIGETSGVGDQNLSH